MSEKKAWDESYKNKDNYVFYPHEEVIRFMSKFVAKQVGIGSYDTKHGCNYTPKLLDFGCGIGRHVKLAHDFKVEGYGIDISNEAIKAGRQMMVEMGVPELAERLIEGEGQGMPFDDGMFDFVVSHGVLDSMPFDTAMESMKEISRCMNANGLAYIDLVSGDDLAHHPEYRDEVVVDTQHEKNTVQSYFNWTKVCELVSGEFEVVDAVLSKRSSLLNRVSSSRYHLVLRKK
jgi:SAM-dependent methyltransferase